MKLVKLQAYALWLLGICLNAAACQLTPATAPTATDSNTEAHATSNSSDSPAHWPGQQTAELNLLSQLGWQSIFDSNGHSINAVLPSNCSVNTWQALGQLHSLVNLTLAGNLPDLPASWADPNSFPVLQSINFTSANLSGTLPDAWAQGTAFPKLKLMDFTATGLSGTLPESWGNKAAFPSLSEVHLAQTNIAGQIANCR